GAGQQVERSKKTASGRLCGSQPLRALCPWRGCGMLRGRVGFQCHGGQEACKRAASPSVRKYALPKREGTPVSPFRVGRCTLDAASRIWHVTESKGLQATGGPICAHSHAQR